MRSAQVVCKEASRFAQLLGKEVASKLLPSCEADCGAGSASFSSKCKEVSGLQQEEAGSDAMQQNSLSTLLLLIGTFAGYTQVLLDTLLKWTLVRR